MSVPRYSPRVLNYMLNQRRLAVSGSKEMHDLDAKFKEIVLPVWTWSKQETEAVMQTLLYLEYFGI